MTVGTFFELMQAVLDWKHFKTPIIFVSGDTNIFAEINDFVETATEEFAIAA